MNQEEYTRYSGCVAFYLRLYERPTFLQRNLRKALSAHQRALINHNPARGTDKMVSGPDHTFLKKEWDVKEIYNLLAQDTASYDDPMLRIDIRHIKDRAARFRDRELSDESLSVEQSLEPIRASCSLTIWDVLQNTLVEQTRACEILPNTTIDQGRNAMIKLIAPFQVPLKLLKTRAKPPGAGEMTYSTQFVLTSVDDISKWPPLDLQIPQPKDARVRDQESDFVRAPLLVAKWTRLPYLPEMERDSLIEIKALQDGKTYKPKLSLKFDAEWVNVDSPLTKYNEELRNKISPAKPCATLHSDMRRVRVLTEWIFKGIVNYMPKVIVHGYVCPLCNGKSFEDLGEYHFHLTNSHDLLEFEYSITLHKNESGQSIVSVLVEVRIADSHYALVEAESKTLAWKRPQRPLDLEAYLQGDLTWVKNEPKPVNLLKSIDNNAEISSSREQSRSEPKHSRKRAIEDIPEIIITKKRKFKVPPAPSGLSYYRTVSKVPLVEGDEMSESDDDISEDWLLQKHADTIDSFTDTLPEEKMFIHRFDKHMLSEDCCSDVHSEEALIRFCKQNKAWLRRPEMKFELAKKLTTLKINRLVSNDILLACLKIANDGIFQSETSNALSEKEASRKGMRSDGEIRRAYHLQSDHTYGECGNCWELIYDKRELQYCMNSTCRWKSYHLRCAHGPENSERRVWLCLDCESRGIKTDPVTSNANTSKAESKAITTPAESETPAPNGKPATESSTDSSRVHSSSRSLPLTSPNPQPQPHPRPRSLPHSQPQSQSQSKALLRHREGNVISTRSLPQRKKRAKRLKTIVLSSDGERWSNSSAENHGHEKSDREGEDDRAEEDDEYVESE